MKRLSILLIIALTFSCGEEDLYVQPDGADYQAVNVVPDQKNKQSESNDVFIIVEDMPEFPGGSKAYNNFLLKNLKYPEQAKKMGVEGRVFIAFIVNEDGSLSDFELIRGIGSGCDEEALRVYMESPNWTPGKQKGKAVKTKMQAQVTFKFSAQGKTATISNETNNLQSRIEELVENGQIDSDSKISEVLKAINTQN